MYDAQGRVICEQIIRPEGMMNSTKKFYYYTRSYPQEPDPTHFTISFTYNHDTGAVNEWITWGETGGVEEEIDGFESDGGIEYKDIYDIKELSFNTMHEVIGSFLPDMSYYANNQLEP